jgi:hypothetical protein
MTTSLPTYIPIKDAAAKYGYGLRDLKRMAQSGKIKAVQLPGGDMIVSENELEFPVINSKEELEAFKQEKYPELAGKTTWISQAAREYQVPHQSIVRWIQAGYIQKFGKEQNRLLISEQDTAFYSDMHKKFGGRGRQLFDDNGLPQRPKTGPLAI